MSGTMHPSRASEPAIEAARERFCGCLLGGAWVAEEALAIAFYCALVAGSFEEGIVLAVNHDGDSDSTGAIAGNLLGAMHGAAAIPEHWLAPLELGELISSIADQLLDYWRVPARTG